MFGFGATKAFNNISNQDFKAKMDSGSAVVLDVRTPAEYQSGRIPGSQMIDFYSPSFRNDIQKLDPAQTYLVYCRSGARSGQAVKLMTEMGFADCYNLEYGIIGWDGPVES